MEIDIKHACSFTGRKYKTILNNSDEIVYVSITIK